MPYRQWICKVLFALITAMGHAATIDDGYENPAVSIKPNSQGFINVFNGHDYEWDDEECISARIYYFDGLSHEMNLYRLDTTHKGHNTDPDIAANNTALAIAWTSNDISDEGIKARVFDPNLNPLTPEFAVNSTTSGKQCEPAMALDAHSRFMVVWTSGTSGSRTVIGRFFDVSSSPLSPEFTIASSGDNFSPSAAVDPNGLFTVAWSSKPAGSSTYSIAFRQYNPNGTPKTAAVWVAQNLVNIPVASVSMNRDCNLIVAWDGHAQDAAQTDIYARLYDPNAIARTVPFRVNTFMTGRQERPYISLSDSGNAVVVWQSENSDGNDYGICGRKIDPNGMPFEGTEFGINRFVYRKQHNADVAMNANNQFFTAWQHEDQRCWMDGRDLYCEYPHEIQIQLGQKIPPHPMNFFGDLSGNGFIDMADLSWIAENWLQWDFRYDIPTADVYPDGHIDITDFYLVACHWMQCYQSLIPPEIIEYYYQSRLIVCTTRLKRIAVAISIYANDNNNKFPSTLNVLIEQNDYFDTPWPEEVYQCPGVCPHLQFSDYVYRGNDLRSSDPGYMVVIYDRQNNHPGGKRNVAFTDGHVQTMTEAEFLAAIEIDNAYRRPNTRLEEKPVE